MDPTGICDEITTVAPTGRCGSVFSNCARPRSRRRRYRHRRPVCGAQSTTLLRRGQRVRGHRKLNCPDAKPSFTNASRPGSNSGGLPTDNPLIVVSSKSSPTTSIASRQRHTRRNHGAEVPETLDTNVHRLESNTHSLVCRNSTVLSIPSRMLSFGFQPKDRTFAVSRKMNGLSPIQPRSPPV